MDTRSLTHRIPGGSFSIGLIAGGIGVLLALGAAQAGYGATIRVGAGVVVFGVAAWVLRRLQTLHVERATETFAMRQARGDFEGWVAEKTRELNLVNEELEREIQQRCRTERRLHEYLSAVEQSNRDLEEFNRIASHDLQEPLRIIQGFGDLLVRRGEDTLDAGMRDCVGEMTGAAARMQRLVQDLLRLSRINTRAGQFHWVDLNEVVNEAMNDALAERIPQDTLPEAAIQVGDLPAVEADPAQMKLLFSCLLTNALKFHDPQKPFHVSVTGRICAAAQQDESTPYMEILRNRHTNLVPQGSILRNSEEEEVPRNGDYSAVTAGHAPRITGGATALLGESDAVSSTGNREIAEWETVEIRLKDNGIGFDEKYLDRIFRPFQRLHGQEEYSGTGIGLALCRRIVERHGGGITATSAVGVGSTFMVVLPLRQRQGGDVDPHG